MYLTFFVDQLKNINIRKYYQKAILFSVSRYEGAYKNGEKHGQGIVTNADGSRCFSRLQDSLLLTYSLTHLILLFLSYVGAFENDEWHGQGVLTSANGYRFSLH